MIKVSIIVPVHNAGEYLKPCLESLVNQTLRDIEIICVLDCPTDGSDKVVEEYAAVDDRVVVIKNEHNLNIGETRNVGLRHARGIYVGFSDHDDFHELNMYQKLWDASGEGKRDAVLSDPIASYYTSEVSWSTLFCSFLGRRCSSHVLPHIYLRRIIEENSIRFIDNNKVTLEDALFNLTFFDAMIEKENFAMLPLELYHHRDFGNNTNLGYSYWAFNKVVHAVELAEHIASNNTDLGPDVNIALSQITIKSFYTSFLREWKMNGFWHTVMLFHKLKKENGCCTKIFQATSPFLPNISIHKRIFIVFIKII